MTSNTNSTSNVPVLTDSSSSFPSQQELNAINIIAKAAATSGFYQGIGQEAKILMILLQAREFGIGPMFALNSGFDNINGSVEMKPVMMNALIRKRGHSIIVKHHDDKRCVLIGTRKDGDSIEEEFTWDEAIKAKLAAKDNWQKYPKDMLYSRCMSRLGRKLFADVLGNVYSDGEVKESIEVSLDEKRLKMADCEVSNVNQPASIEEPPKEPNQDNIPPPPPKEFISQEHLGFMLDMLKELKILDPEYIVTLDANMKKYYGTSNYEEIPAKHAKSLIDKMTLHIQEKKKAVK